MDGASHIVDLEAPRPMDTAPRNGKHVLVRFKEKGFAVVYWIADEDSWVLFETDSGMYLGWDTDEIEGWWPLP